MRNKLAAVTATCALAAVAYLPSAGAQDNAAREAEQRQAQAEREQAERESRAAREEAQRESRAERESMQRELADARRELEEAAREVARLSAQAADPAIKEMQRAFRFQGQRSMLGIGIEDTERGVRVASVTPSGPAARAGLQIGETIVAIDGAELTDRRETGAGKQSPSELLLAQMQNVDPGETVKLRVVGDNGAEREVSVQAQSMSPFVTFLDNGRVFKGPGDLSVFRLENGPGITVLNNFFRTNTWSDMQLVALTPELGAYFGTTKGLLVVRGPGNDALRLQDGDVILDIGGREPTSPEHAVRILSSFQEGETLKITVMRKQRRETLEFQMPAAG